MSKYKITLDELLMGRDSTAPLDRVKIANAAKLLVALNFLRDKWGKPLQITSGYRPAVANATAGGSKSSAHLTCEAADVADPKGELKAWIAANPTILEELDLYMEDPGATPTWCHLQTRSTKTGKRVFLP